MWRCFIYICTIITHTDEAQGILHQARIQCVHLVGESDSGMRNSTLGPKLKFLSPLASMIEMSMVSEKETWVLRSPEGLPRIHLFTTGGNTEVGGLKKTFSFYPSKTCIVNKFWHFCSHL